MTILNGYRFVSAMALVVASLAIVAALTSTGRSLQADDSDLPRTAGDSDEQAIRKTAASFEAAFRDKKAEALAAHYAPDGEVVDTSGNAVRGRKAITEEFQRLFDEHRDAKMSITIKSIRFVSPGVAIEDGTTALVLAKGQPGILGRYTAVQVKQDGHWLIASTRDLAAASDAIPISERLKPLEFLIGDWVDESEDAIVATSYRWGEKRTHLVHQFSVKRAGAPLLQGKQRIGWDPLRRTIMSWNFDLAGGHGEGIWTWDHDHWIIKMSGVSAAGAPSSATVLLTPVNRDHFRWQSTNRIVGSETAPDVSVTVVRKPPAPHEMEKAAGPNTTSSNSGDLNPSSAK